MVALFWFKRFEHSFVNKILHDGNYCNYLVVFYRYKDNIPYQEITEEFHGLVEHLSKVALTKALCHNDLWSSNILYDKENGQGINILNYRILAVQSKAFKKIEFQ